MRKVRYVNVWRCIRGVKLQFSPGLLLSVDAGQSRMAQVGSLGAGVLSR
jgi:hypothetical protein